MAEGDTLVNVLVGALVSIVLSSVLPLSPVVGGATAGYLQGGDRSEGIRVGVYSGLVAAVPLALFVLFVLAVFTGVAVTPGGGTAFFVVVFLLAVVAAAVYTVACSAVGGWLGNYLKYETDYLE